MQTPVLQNSRPYQRLILRNQITVLLKKFRCLFFPFARTKQMENFKSKLILVCLLVIAHDISDTDAYILLLEQYIFPDMFSFDESKLPWENSPNGHIFKLQADQLTDLSRWIEESSNNTIGGMTESVPVRGPNMVSSPIPALLLINLHIRLPFSNSLRELLMLDNLLQNHVIMTSC